MATESILNKVNVFPSLSSFNNNSAAVDSNSLNLIKTGAVLIETWSNGKSWYRKWSDGWIEQGGLASDLTVTLNTEFATTDYTVLFGSDGTYYKQEHWELVSQTTVSFTAVGWLPTLPYWEAKGY